MWAWTQKENAVNYLTRNHSSTEQYYYYEDSYALNDYTKGLWLNYLVSNAYNWRKSKWNQSQNYCKYNGEDQYVRDGNYNHKNNFIQNKYGNKNHKVGPYVPPKNQ